MQNDQGTNLSGETLTTADIVGIVGAVVGVVGLFVFFFVKPEPCIPMPHRHHAASDTEHGNTNTEAVNIPLNESVQTPQDELLLRVGGISRAACGDVHGGEPSARVDGEEDISLGHEDGDARDGIVAVINNVDQALQARPAPDTSITGSITNHLTVTAWLAMVRNDTGASQPRGSLAATGFADQAPSAPTLSELGSNGYADPEPLHRYYSNPL